MRWIYPGLGALVLAGGALAFALAGPERAAPRDYGALLTGEMAGFAAADRLASDVPFALEDGSAATLADWKGKVVVVNFWATWCAPCREEMPTFSALQSALGGDDFAVLTIASGRNPPPAIAAFMDEIGVENLPLATDAQQALTRSMGVLGLPTTVVLGRDGREVGRLIGEADWSAPETLALMRAIMGEGVGEAG